MKNVDSFDKEIKEPIEIYDESFWNTVDNTLSNLDQEEIVGEYLDPDIFKETPFSCDYCKNNSTVCEALCENYSMWEPVRKSTESTQEKIDILFDNFKEFLKEKNKRYGDSALSPLQIFPTDDKAIAEICIRINDKCSRIKNSTEGLRKSDVCDLFGYISLLMIKKNWLNFKEEID